MILLQISNVETRIYLNFTTLLYKTVFFWQLFYTKQCFSHRRSNAVPNCLFRAERAYSHLFRTPKIIEIDQLFVMIGQFLCWSRLILHDHPYFGIHGRMVGYHLSMYNVMYRLPSFHVSQITGDHVKLIDSNTKIDLSSRIIDRFQ